MHDQRRDTLIDATLILEIVSPATKGYDIGEKFFYYRSLPSFREYLLLWQDCIRAEHHVRLPDGDWKLYEFAGADCVIELNSIGCKLELGSLYERVTFDPHPPTAYEPPPHPPRANRLREPDSAWLMRE